MTPYSFSEIQEAFPARRDNATEDANDSAEVFPKGQRNSMMTSYAGSLRQAGMSPETLLSALRSKNRECCTPPLPDREIQAIAKSIGKKEPGKQKQVSLAIVTCLNDVEPEKVQWLWDSRIALGKLTLIAGNPGLGKSLMTLGMAACVSVGGKWPDGTSSPIGDVLILSAEDDPADTIRPRMDAAGADVRRVSMLESVYDIDDAGRRLPYLDKDIDAVEETLRRIPDCKLLIVDPISAYMGNTDSHNNSDVRMLLAKLSELAAKYKVAVVVVSHLNKSQGTSVAYRVTGSLAFTAAARAAYAVVQDPDDAERRIFTPIKNNLGDDKTGFAYTITTTMNNQPVLLWDKNPIMISADDLLNKNPNKKQPRQRICIWLHELLGGGPMFVNEIKEMADKKGYSWSTVTRAKKDELIKTERVGFGKGSKIQWRRPTPAEFLAALSEAEKDAPQVEEGGAIAEECPF